MLNALNNKRKEDLQATKAFNQKQKRQKRKRTIKDYTTRHDDAQKDSKTNTVIHFVVLSMTSLMCFGYLRRTKQLRTFMKCIRFKNVLPIRI